MPAELRDALTLLPLSLHIILVLAALGLPLIAAISQVLARARKKAFLDRFGRQVSPLSIGLYVYTAAVSAAVWLLLAKRPDMAPILDRSMPLLPIIGAAMAAAFVALLLYTLTWKRLKENKPLHIALGFLAVLLSLAYLVVAAGAKYQILQSTGPVQPDLAALLPAFSPEDPFWPLVALSIALAVASAGALCPAYLLLRRNRDDFGRDYYSYTLRAAALWAIITAVLQLLAQAWPFLVLRQIAGERLLTGSAPIEWAASAVLFLIACVCWAIIRRADNPLRRKGEVIAALVAFWAAVTCLLLALFTAFGIALPPLA